MCILEQSRDAEAPYGKGTAFAITSPVTTYIDRSFNHDWRGCRACACYSSLSHECHQQSPGTHRTRQRQKTESEFATCGQARHTYWWRFSNFVLPVSVATQRPLNFPSPNYCKAMMIRAHQRKYWSEHRGRTTSLDQRRTEECVGGLVVLLCHFHAIGVRGHQL